MAAQLSADQPLAARAQRVPGAASGLQAVLAQQERPVPRVLRVRLEALERREPLAQVPLEHLEE